MIIDILKHALELAREGVEIHNENSPEYKVCAALIATLEAKDEPVAWMDSADDVFYTEEDAYKVGFQPIRPLYTTPPSAPVQEPVANASAWFALVMNAAAELEDASHCLRDEDAKRVAISGAKHYRDAAKALYTTPPQRKPLTELEAETLFDNCGGKWNGDHWVIKDADLHDFARAIEANLNIKGE